MKSVRVFIRNNWLSLLLLVLLLGYAGQQRLPQYLSDTKLIGQSVGDLRLTQAASPLASPPSSPNEQISLLDLRGKKVLLYFFASWCGACKFQLSSIKKIHKEISGKDFHLIAVSEENPVLLTAYQKKKQIKFPLYMDTQARLHDRFQVKSYPTMVRLDAEGEIVDVEHGLDLLLLYAVRFWVKGSFL